MCKFRPEKKVNLVASRKQQNQTVMKHQSLSKSPTSKFHASKLDDRHKKPASKSKPRPTCEPPHKKPLSGRIFYLDLPCNKRSQTLETDIKNLGGTVEKFFSKEIRYLVTSKPEARHVMRLVQYSPVPSPDSGLSSPQPASKMDRYRGSSQGPADTVVVSRGKSLVEKVVKEQERFQMNKILANALEWGVKILYIDDVLSYVDKKKSEFSKHSTATRTVKKAPDPTERTAFQKCNTGRISRPFVKVEDSSRHYRPIYLPMATMPVCNFKSAAPCSPFLVEDANNGPGKKPKVHGSEGDQAARGRKDRHRGREGKGRRKGGYCECCIVKFDSLKAHLQSEQHQAFSKSEEYLVVDRVISGLTCDLIHISTQAKRVKCSVSSPVLIPGAALRGEEEIQEVKDEKGSSPNTDFDGETPRPVRKRCRELSLSPGEDDAEQSGALEKSESKRGSFEWECSANGALRKALGAALPNTKKGCCSDSLERNRASMLVNSKLRPSLRAQSSHHVRSLQSMADRQKLETSSNQLDARSVWKTYETKVVSEPAGIGQLHFQTTQSLLDIAGTKAFKERPLPKSGQPSDTANHSSTTADKSLYSRNHEPASTDSATRTFQRKVRSSRRRRKNPPEDTPGLSSKHVESPSSKKFNKASETLSLSPSASDLWQLFRSSSDTEEDFKGFYD